MIIVLFVGILILFWTQRRTHTTIDMEKLYYALPVYHPMFVSKLDDSTINFTIPDSTFLEVLLLQIRGETIK